MSWDRKVSRRLRLVVVEGAGYLGGFDMYEVLFVGVVRDALQIVVLGLEDDAV